MLRDSLLLRIYGPCIDCRSRYYGYYLHISLLGPAIYPKDSHVRRESTGISGVQTIWVEMFAKKIFLVSCPLWRQAVYPGVVHGQQLVTIVGETKTPQSNSDQMLGCFVQMVKNCFCSDLAVIQEFWALLKLTTPKTVSFRFTVWFFGPLCKVGSDAQTSGTTLQDGGRRCPGTVMLLRDAPPFFSMDLVFQIRASRRSLKGIHRYLQGPKVFSPNLGVGNWLFSPGCFGRIIGKTQCLSWLLSHKPPCLTC